MEKVPNLWGEQYSSNIRTERFLYLFCVEPPWEWVTQGYIMVKVR